MSGSTTTIYLYECVDGVVRQRCREHIERTGARSPSTHLPRYKVLIHKFESADPASYGCIRCSYERVLRREYRAHDTRLEVQRT